MAERSELEQANFELRAARLRLGTLEACIADAGGLEQLCSLVREHRPVHPACPPELAAWVAWCQAGGADDPSRVLPWLEEPHLQRSVA